MTKKQTTSAPVAPFWRRLALGLIVLAVIQTTLLVLLILQQVVITRFIDMQEQQAALNNDNLQTINIGEEEFKQLNQDEIAEKFGGALQQMANQSAEMGDDMRQGMQHVSTVLAGMTQAAHEVSPVVEEITQNMEKLVEGIKQDMPALQEQLIDLQQAVQAYVQKHGAELEKEFAPAASAQETPANGEEPEDMNKTPN